MSGSSAPQDVQAAFVSVLVDEWLRAGVTDAVASPGSRSSPLLVALADAAERDALRLHVKLDERAAAFFALGLGLASGMPAPVVTTSGTAAVELHPAIVEANHAGVPMVAVTADRPEELQDCGAPQTVRQVGLYGSAVRWEAVPGVPELSAARSWRSLASRSVAEARGNTHRPGPVHLNLAFREPLLGSADELLSGIGRGGSLGEVPRGRADGAPWHHVDGPEEITAPAQVVEALASAGERGLIVAGAGSGRAEAVWELSRATSWPVLADPISGCRWPGAISAADALLRFPALRAWRPDVVLRLGVPWASRVLNEWLATLDCPQVLVDRWGTWAAPDRLPGQIVVTSPEAFCRAVAVAVAAPPSGAWAAQWAGAEDRAQRAVASTLAGEGKMTEPGIARAVVRAAPPGATLFVSSSMPIRDVEWWGEPRQGLRTLANRGANGIDGVLSTALGVAASRRGRSGHEGAVVALVGDLAFLYDAGALLRATNAETDIVIVVVDNDGGGIFSFLPQATGQSRQRFERLWGTPHGADLCAVARSYGAEAEELFDLSGLTNGVAQAGRGRGVRVLVAKTSRDQNVTVHGRLHSAIGAALQGLVK